MSQTVFPSGSKQTNWFAILSMLAVGLLAFLVYSRALDFAFFNDDPTGHFAWMETRGYTDYFRSSAGYGYYRPVVFTVLQGMVDTFAYNARAFHALLLGLHAANVALLWLLSWRLSRSGLFAWITALIFAFAPFSYEAVTYVASLTHPLLLFWLLLTLLFYQQARRAVARKKQFIFYGAAMVTLLLGLLTHENGLFIPLAIAGVEWLERSPKGFVESLKRPFWPYMLAALLFLAIWWSIPKTSEQVLPSLSGWGSNLVPFLQTLAYPLLPLFHLTAEQTTFLSALAVIMLVVTFGAAWLARAVPLWLFGLGWFLLSALPATLFLSPDYLYGSPRLHYLPAVGVALLWAMPALALARRLPQKARGQLAAAVVAFTYTLVIILPPLNLITCEMDFYDETTRIVRRMGELGRETSVGRDLLFVNVPIFFSSYAGHPQGCQNPYPWTPVGAVVMPAYANARDFVGYNGGPKRAAAAVSVTDYAPGWNTFGTAMTSTELRERVQDSAVYVYELNVGDFLDLSAVWQPEQPLAAQPLAKFENGLQLNELVIDHKMGYGFIVTTLTWQANEIGGESRTPAVFVHLYDSSGGLAAQHDGPPAGNLVPAGWWQTGDEIIDRHAIRLERDLPAGTYTIGVGIYDPQTGERFAASGAEGALPDNLLIAGQAIVP